MRVRIKHTLEAGLHFLERGPYGLMEVFRYYTHVHKLAHTHPHNRTMLNCEWWQRCTWHLLNGVCHAHKQEAGRLFLAACARTRTSLCEPWSSVVAVLLGSMITAGWLTAVQDVKLQNCLSKQRIDDIYLHKWQAPIHRKDGFKSNCQNTCLTGPHQSHAGQLLLFPSTAALCCASPIHIKPAWYL